MRHIPEDELHAYLDQALSRSQCVEIESHLAGCAECQAERDGIAALRDRTTALLAALAPPRRLPPAFEVLREKADARSARRADRWRAGVWAASVLLALALGWAGKSMIEQRDDPAGVAARARAPEPPAPASRLVQSIAAPERPASGAPAPDSGTIAPPSLATRRDAASRGASPRRDRPVAATESAPFEPVSAVLSSGQLLGSNLDITTGAVFRTVSWDYAQHERGESVPRIAGLPVVEVQVGTSREGGGNPLVVVAQQLESGQVIRTIEGPATDVNNLLASRRNDTGSPWPTIGDSAGIAGGDGAMVVRRGDRILAITAPLSSDSLRAMIRRLNVMDR